MDSSFFPPADSDQGKSRRLASSLSAAWMLSHQNARLKDLLKLFLDYFCNAPSIQCQTGFPFFKLYLFFCFNPGYFFCSARILGFRLNEELHRNDENNRFLQSVLRVLFIFLFSAIVAQSPKLFRLVCLKVDSIPCVCVCVLSL